MTDSTLLPDLISLSAARDPAATALTYGKNHLSYDALQQAVNGFTNGMIASGLQRGERVAIYLEKRFETVVASFGATAAGGVFVPLNPLLKPEQLAYILRDCNVRVLVTSTERLALLTETLKTCHDLRHVVIVNVDAVLPETGHDHSPLEYSRLHDLLQPPVQGGHRVIDTDMAAIL